MNESLVSVIIPTKNSSKNLARCLKQIRLQRYKKIEIIIVDGNSTDATLQVARAYKCKIFRFTPYVKYGLFDATAKRNYGAAKARGKYIYYVDADMELTKDVVSEAVGYCERGYDAVIIPEDSIGEGLWARAKNLERRCYWGDDMSEAPRFFNKRVWVKLGGLDERIGGAGDDWDLYQKTLEQGYRVGRIKSIVLHNEGKPKLWQVLRRQFIYRQDSVKYFRKRPLAAFKGYFPIKLAYLRNWRLFASRPVDTLLFIVMRTGEVIAGGIGILYSLARL